MGDSTPYQGRLFRHSSHQQPEHDESVMLRVTEPWGSDNKGAVLPLNEDRASPILKASVPPERRPFLVELAGSRAASSGTVVASGMVVDPGVRFNGPHGEVRPVTLAVPTRVVPQMLPQSELAPRPIAAPPP